MLPQGVTYLFLLGGSFGCSQTWSVCYGLQLPRPRAYISRPTNTCRCTANLLLSWTRSFVQGRPAGKALWAERGFLVTEQRRRRGLQPQSIGFASYTYVTGMVWLATEFLRHFRAYLQTQLFLTLVSGTDFLHSFPRQLLLVINLMGEATYRVCDFT